MKSYNICIQRLVIYHQGFACRDESASLEELSDYILYYNHVKHHLSHCFSKDNKNRDLWRNKDNNGYSFAENIHDKDQIETILQEAIQFVGLCEAVQGLSKSLLSSSLFPNTSPNVQAKKNSHILEEIHLYNSTLIFVPIEEQCFAVAEVYRHSASEGERNFTIINPCKVCNATKSSLDQHKSNPSIINTEHKISNENSSYHHPQCTNKNNYYAAGGDPSIIGLKIQLCHKLFCMVEGKGGIINRIGKGRNEKSVEFVDNNTGIDNYLMNDMDKIMALRKTLRKTKAALKSLLHETLEHDTRNNLSEESGKQNIESDENDVISEIEDQKQHLSNIISKTEHDINKLIPIIPITSLKKDLESHYDNFLKSLIFPSCIDTLDYSWKRNMNLLNNNWEVSIMGNNHKDSTNNQDYNQSSLEKSGTVMVGRLKDKLLDIFRREGLVAVSSFHNGKLLWTQNQAIEVSDPDSLHRTGSNRILISRDETILLYDYVCKIQKSCSMSNLQQNPGKDNLDKTEKAYSSSENKIKLGEKKLQKTNFKNIKDNVSIDSQTFHSRISPAISGNEGYFARPPAQPSNINNLHSISIGNNISVWCLPLHIPNNEGAESRDLMRKDSLDEYDTKSHDVMVYFCGKFHFLLYFNANEFASFHRSSKSPILRTEGINVMDGANIFQSAVSQWSLFSNLFSTDIGNTTIDPRDEIKEFSYKTYSASHLCLKIAECISTEILSYEKKLQKIHRLLPFRDNYMQSKRFEKSGLDLFLIDEIYNYAILHTKNASFKHIIDQCYPLCGNYDDVSFCLSGNITHDVVMALNEIFVALGTSDEYSYQNDSYMWEICTFLPKKWVYAGYHNHRKLIILFDVDSFLTFTDVQKEVSRVRDELFKKTL